MKLAYHVDTDSLYIDLANRSSTECIEIHDGVVLDFDSDGTLIGIDIDQVSSLPEKLEIIERIPSQPGSSDD